MKAWLLKIWHDTFYRIVPSSGEKFAMTCREAVERINSAESLTWIAWFRLKLHLSLCSACRHYLQTSRILGEAVRKLVSGSRDSVDLEKLNRELLKKFANIDGGSDRD